MEYISKLLDGKNLFNEVIKLIQSDPLVKNFDIVEKGSPKKIVVFFKNDIGFDVKQPDDSKGLTKKLKTIGGHRVDVSYYYTNAIMVKIRNEDY